MEGLERLNNGPPSEKPTKSWRLTSKEPPGVKGSVVAEAGHTVSPDINVLLEATPPRAPPRHCGRGGRNKGGHCESHIKRDEALHARAHSAEKIAIKVKIC